MDECKTLGIGLLRGTGTAAVGYRDSKQLQVRLALVRTEKFPVAHQTRCARSPYEL